MSETLGAATLFFSYVKLFIENTDPYLNGKLNFFDDLVMELKEHKRSIIQNVVDKMKDVLDYHANHTTEFDWDGGQRKDSPFVLILKTLILFHKILVSHLSTHPNDLKSLSTIITTMYSDKMKICVRSLQRTGLSRKAIRNLKEDVVLVSNYFQKWLNLLNEFDCLSVYNCFDECFVVV